MAGLFILQARELPESLHGADLSVAQWVMDHNEIAGQGTNTLPGAEAIYFPLSNKESCWVFWFYCRSICGVFFCPNNKNCWKLSWADCPGDHPCQIDRASQN